MDKPHVLDILAKKQGCFVSDLRLNPINRRAALADLLLLDDSAFPFEGVERSGLLPHEDNPDF